MRTLRPLFIALTLGALSISACSGADDDNLGLSSSGDPSGTSSSSSGNVVPPEEPLVPAPGGLRRLLSRQYINSVREIFGDTAALAANPPPDSALRGFDNIGAAELALPEAAVEAYESSARAIAKAVTEDLPTFDSLLPCMPSGPDDSLCYDMFVRSAGRIAWRRALDDQEAGLLVNIALAAGAQYQSFEIGASYAISGLLQSPYFLYAVEVGEPDPAEPEYRKLTSLELASRMSFFLTDTTPSAALLDKAETGGLAAENDIRAAAQELVAKPQAKAALAEFFAEIYRLRELETVEKDTNLFPKFTASLPPAMRQEVLELINDVVWTRNSDMHELFTANYAFVNAELAGLYGVAPPASGFQKTLLPADQKRAGFLGSAAFLARFAHPGMTSPTRRGTFIQTMLFCTEIPPPPPGVNTTFPADDPNQPKTMKQKLEAHMNDPNCAGCHKLIDPVGFALENYDPIGAYRTTDKGLPIDPSGTVESLGSFASAADLAGILSQDPRGAQCMIKNLFRHSMGHVETKGERPAMTDLEEGFTQSGFRIQDLLVNIVLSPAFQRTNQPK